MKLKILILLLLPLSLFSQTKGKIVRNQSVKATSIWIDTLSFKMWLVEIKNTNNCVSDIQIVDGEDTTTFDVEPMGTVKVLADDFFVIKFRNGTSCAGGSMDWLSIDYKELVKAVTLGNQYLRKNEITFHPITIPPIWLR